MQSINEHIKNLKEQSYQDKQKISLILQQKDDDFVELQK